MRAWPEARRKGVKEKVGGGSVDVVETMEAAATAAASCAAAEAIMVGEWKQDASESEKGRAI